MARFEESELQQEAAEAALRGDAATLRECLKKGLSPMDISVYLSALEYGDVETVQVILDAGGDINYCFEYTGSPLISALRHNHPDLLEFFSPMTLIPTWGIGFTGYPHLVSPCERMHLLLEHGADVNEITFMDVIAFVDYHGAGYHAGGTPLHWAIAGGHARAVKLLLDLHADLSVLDKEGISAGDRLAEFEKHNSL
ncbi:uncharacterized protein N7482_003182 [Penicillium canariense]|uniref:Ankyrin repeat domain-containing protein n=1 Tax=Penicillium canariense TaxID=189055 RepID=A0A9W9LPC6_9EURO|nr:uncharacterized protein N7482_003182 [Penicillium canariense]KAJ5167588.1 hypothetical protein N7482_003182 [Penicillium canariense]